MPETEKEETARKGGIAYAAAFTLFMSVAVMTGFGWAMDRWFGTTPWLLVAGIVFGAIVGFYQFVRLTSKL